MALATIVPAGAHGIADFALNAAKNGYKSLVLTGDLTLSDSYPTFLGLDPGGAGRTITLDGAAATDGAVDGVVRVIVNRADAAENLTVQDAAAGAVATINQNEAGIFYHDATDGWALVAVLAVSLS